MSLTATETNRLTGANPNLDATDAAILRTAVDLHDVTTRPQVGDLLRFPDGSYRRIASDLTKYDPTWGYQPSSPRFGESFHLSSTGAMSHSGGLASQVPADSLTDSGETIPVPAWIWHHGRSGGDNGAEVRVFVRVWDTTADAPRF